MKLWLLRPVTGDEEVGPWDPWYDKTFGFVVRAETEEEARAMAEEEGGDENRAGYGHRRFVWRDPALTTCEELTQAGEPGVVMKDFQNG